MPEPVPVPRMSPEEYLEWEKTSEVKHEYVGGQIFAMAGVTTAHGRIALNLASMLLNHTRGGPCEPYVSDVKVWVAAAQSFYYPDVFVTCDARDRSNEQFQEYPRLIVEVLSPSTAAFDRGLKFEHYATLASLEEYALIDSERRSVHCFRRTEGGVWAVRVYAPGDEVRFDSLGFAFSMDAVYEGVRPPAAP